MPDPYLPRLNTLILSDDETAAITTALAHGNPWDHNCAELAHVSVHLISAKAKLVDHHMARHGGTCCYCRTILAGTGPFQRDREHILPKGQFPTLSYEPSNLSVSCKRCNMEFKKEKTDFVVDVGTILSDHENPGRYVFVHPNHDRYEDHILRCSIQIGTKYIVSYSFSSADPKAQFMFDFFDLATIQRDTWDSAQGLEKVRQMTDEIESTFPDRV